LIDALRLKLETKQFNIAKQYYRTLNFKAAVTAFENLRKDYPGGTFDEEASFLAFKSEYEYARQSIENRQSERYKESKELYLQLVDKFPQSRYLREAEKLYADIEEELARITGTSR
jgi:outer membrane protein assembly factor BamD